jgi:colanic acid/amylovoran biosynthesis glycosyltransferase
VTTLGVAHSFEVWLPLTMTWAYNQVRLTPAVEAIVLAGRTENLEAFPWRPVYVPTSAADRLRLAATDRARRRAYPWSWGDAMRRHRPHVLHSHFGYRGWRDVPLARRFDVPHVVTFYGHDVTMFPRRWPVWRRRYAELFAAADLFLCEGPYMMASLVAQGCPQAKVRVQRLGVELDRLPCVPREAPADGIVRILMAGAFREKKGMPLALAAVARLRPRHDVRVTVIGDAGPAADEQAEKRRILEVVDREGLRDVVHFLGFTPYERLIEEAYRHHIFLSPSVVAADGDCEGGSPVIITEMAASGMPVASSTHCDIPEVVVDGVTGVLAPEGDLIALATRLEELCDAPERWAAMGRAARSRMEELFDVRRCTAALAARYHELAGQSGPGTAPSTGATGSKSGSGKPSDRSGAAPR